VSCSAMVAECEGSGSGVCAGRQQQQGKAGRLVAGGVRVQGRQQQSGVSPGAGGRSRKEAQRMR